MFTIIHDLCSSTTMLIFDNGPKRFSWISTMKPSDVKILTLGHSHNMILHQLLVITHLLTFFGHLLGSVQLLTHACSASNSSLATPGVRRLVNLSWPQQGPLANSQSHKTSQALPSLRQIMFIGEGPLRTLNSPIPIAQFSPALSSGSRKGSLK